MADRSDDPEATIIYELGDFSLLLSPESDELKRSLRKESHLASKLANTSAEQGPTPESSWSRATDVVTGSCGMKKCFDLEKISDLDFFELRHGDGTGAKLANDLFDALGVAEKSEQPIVQCEVGITELSKSNAFELCPTEISEECCGDMKFAGVVEEEKTEQVEEKSWTSPEQNSLTGFSDVFREKEGRNSPEYSRMQHVTVRSSTNKNRFQKQVSLSTSFEIFNELFPDSVPHGKGDEVKKKLFEPSESEHLVEFAALHVNDASKDEGPPAALFSPKQEVCEEIVADCITNALSRESVGILTESFLSTNDLSRASSCSSGQRSANKVKQTELSMTGLCCYDNGPNTLCVDRDGQDSQRKIFPTVFGTSDSRPITMPAPQPKVLLMKEVTLSQSGKNAVSKIPTMARGDLRVGQKFQKTNLAGHGSLIPQNPFSAVKLPKMNKFQNVASPVSRYIRESPVSPLVHTVKVHSSIPVCSNSRKSKIERCVSELKKNKNRNFTPLPLSTYNFKEPTKTLAVLKPALRVPALPVLSKHIVRKRTAATGGNLENKSIMANGALQRKKIAAVMEKSIVQFSSIEFTNTISGN